MKFDYFGDHVLAATSVSPLRVCVLLPEEWARKRENKVVLLVKFFFLFFLQHALSRLVTCSLSQ